MEKKTANETPSRSDAAEELDALNAEHPPGVRSSDRLRRKIEATIEAKARKRRSKETAASTALRQQLGKNSG